MLKVLFLESSTKKKTISSFLNDSYKIFATHGHLWNLKNSGEYNLGVDLNTFQTSYEVSPLKRQTLLIWKNFFEKERKNIEIVYLATDPDREGEKIAQEIIESLKLLNFPYRRLLFHEITPHSIHESIKNPLSINKSLIDAQVSRQVLDKMIGFCISPILKKKFLSPSISAGRIQSFVLKMIVDRERLIEKGKDDKDYVINFVSLINERKIIFKKVNLIDYSLVLYKDIQVAKKDIFGINELFFLKKDFEEKIIPPKHPFTTSSLLSEAKNKLSFSISKTTLIAQKLYEGVNLWDNKMIGLISYPRTDSKRINDFFSKKVYDYIKKSWGDKYCNFSPLWKREKKTINIQDAHEAIRPTYLESSYFPESLRNYLTNDEYLLYKMIFDRTVSCLMAPSRIKKITYIFNDINKSNFFLSTERICQFDGFFLYDLENNLREYGVITNSYLNNVSKLNVDGEINEWFGNKFFRYNEGSIVNELESLGIGRPSTYRTFTDILIKRRYVIFNEKRNFVPTSLGSAVNDWLQKNFSYLINKNYTSYLEEELDKISSGNNTYLSFIGEFWKNFSLKIKSFG